jgi:hypothetical protein
VTVLMAGGTALVFLGVVLTAGVWRLVVLDRDLARLDDELGRLQEELRRIRRQLGNRDDRWQETVVLTRQIRSYLEWLDPWARHWVAISQERGR